MNLDFYQRPSTPVLPSWSRAAALSEQRGWPRQPSSVRYLTQRAESEHRPIGKFASLGTTQIHYVDRGSEPPVVVLHGNGMHDRRAGLGGSSASSRSRTSYYRSRSPRLGSPRASIAIGAEHEARAAGLHEPASARTSRYRGPFVGDLVALSLALEEPDAVSGLVLIGDITIRHRLDAALQRLVALPVVGDLYRRTLLPLVSRAAAPMAFKKIFSPLRPTDAFHCSNIRSGDGQLAVFNYCSVADDTVDMPRARPRFLPRYGELPDPYRCDCWYGRQGIRQTAHQGRRLNRELHNSYFDEVPGVGHMLHHACPELIERGVVGVLKRAAGPIRCRALLTVSPEGRGDPECEAAWAFERPSQPLRSS